MRLPREICLFRKIVIPLRRQSYNHTINDICNNNNTNY